MADTMPTMTATDPMRIMQPPPAPASAPAMPGADFFANNPQLLSLLGGLGGMGAGQATSPTTAPGSSPGAVGGLASDPGAVNIAPGTPGPPGDIMSLLQWLFGQMGMGGAGPAAGAMPGASDVMSQLKGKLGI